MNIKCSHACLSIQHMLLLAPIHLWKIGIIGSLTQLFEKLYNGSGGKLTGNNQRGGMVCDSYFSTQISLGKSTKHIVKYFDESFQRDLELLKKAELSQTYAKFLASFYRKIYITMIKKGYNLGACAKYNLIYYEEVIDLMSDIEMRGEPDFIHGMEKLLNEFYNLYKDSGKFCSSLVFCLQLFLKNWAEIQTQHTHQRK